MVVCSVGTSASNEVGKVEVESATEKMSMTDHGHGGVEAKSVDGKKLTEDDLHHERPETKCPRCHRQRQCIPVDNDICVGRFYARL